MRDISYRHIGMFEDLITVIANTVWSLVCSSLHTILYIIFYSGCSNLTNQIAQNEVCKSLANLWLGLKLIYKPLP